MTAIDSSDDRRRIRRFVADWRSEQGLPGVAVVVVDADGRSLAESSGVRSLESERPITPDTVLGVGSCTKPVTAAAVLRLAERGALSLSDAASDYVPVLAAAPGEPITVGELLTHSSGLPSDGIGVTLAAQALYDDPVGRPIADEADFWRSVERSLDRRVTDRDVVLYSNTGYALLGEIVSTVADAPFDEYVERAVLAPHGLERATFDPAALETTDDATTPRLRIDGEVTRVPFPDHERLAPSGGLLASAGDLGEFVRAILRVEAHDRPVPVRGDLATTYACAGTLDRYYDGEPRRYGHGLVLEAFLGRLLAGHGGRIGVSSAWLGAVPDADLGVCLTAVGEPDRSLATLGRGVLAILLGERPHAVLPEHRLRSALDAVTGSYEDFRQTDSVTVRRVEGALRLRIGSSLDERTLLLVPETVGDRELVCSTVTADGRRRRARFERLADEVRLFFGRSRYVRVDDGG